MGGNKRGRFVFGGMELFFLSNCLKKLVLISGCSENYGYSKTGIGPKVILRFLKVFRLAIK